jgi:N-acetylglucosaminyldiphosphoundecaprenol N-acetyl-beta-D-mannosaminyltransferase
MKNEIILCLDNKIKRYRGIFELFSNLEKPSIITFVNTFSYYQLLDSGCSIELIDIIFVDGLLHVLFHNIFHKTKINRASFDFSSMANDVFFYAVENNLKVAIIGASEGEINNGVLNIKNRYNKLNIVYYRNGYFNSDDDKHSALNALKLCNVDIVILGMGTPAQDDFALYLKNNGLASIIFTCGGFVTQSARRIDYYKNFIKKYNLRWLQRIVEYKAIRHRLFFSYPKNIVRYLFDQFDLAIQNKEYL